MVNKLKMFLSLQPQGQIGYLNDDEFSYLSQKEKIEFLKTILREDLAAETIVCSLFLLEKLHYPDRYYFRRFQFHKDKTVSDAARKIIRDLYNEGKQQTTFVDMLREGKTEDLIILANYFLNQEGKLNENALLAFLHINNIKVRDIIVRTVTAEHELDEALLSAAITQGSAWYVRAALVEILGNRKSQHLFDCIDFLMSDKNVEVKLKLIDALTKLGIEKGKIYLQQLTQDSIIWVRKQAYRVLQGH